MENLLASNAKDKKIGIVQNEFAPIGIDGELLNQSGFDFEILEINNGSVFCVCLLGNFIESIYTFIHEHSPDIIILEASGLSDPGNISELISNGKLVDKLFLAQNITIVDAANFLRSISKVGRVLQQVKIADTILINKIDKVPGPLLEIRTKIKGLNPFARVYESTYCKIDFKLVPAFRLDFGIRKSNINLAPRPDIDTMVVKMHQALNMGLFREFVKKWGEIAFRIKGFVKTKDGAKAVQSCFNEVDFVPIENYQGISQLVILGRGIDKKALLKDLKTAYY